jgi:hypothetical protein
LHVCIHAGACSCACRCAPKWCVRGRVYVRASLHLSIKHSADLQICVRHPAPRMLQYSACILLLTTFSRSAGVCDGWQLPTKSPGIQECSLREQNQRQDVCMCVCVCVCVRVCARASVHTHDDTQATNIHGSMVSCACTQGHPDIDRHRQTDTHTQTHATNKSNYQIMHGKIVPGEKGDVAEKPLTQSCLNGL